MTLSALYSPKPIIQYATSCSKSQAEVLPGEREETEFIAEQEGKWGLRKIIRFLHGITLTQLRNLYAGNLHFDPDMQKVKALIGTIQTVI